MAIWKNSRLYGVSLDGNITEVNYPCQVIIDEKRIVVSYFEEGEAISYTGANKNNDHFFLECHEINGEASLHRFPNANLLVGTWVEDGEEGFWKIELK